MGETTERCSTLAFQLLLLSFLCLVLNTQIPILLLNLNFTFVEPFHLCGVGVEFVRYAVVTGANKGIGLEIVRQLASAGIKVVLTARNEERGIQALQTLKDSGLSHLVLFHQVDVADATSVASLADFIKSKFGKLDILVTCNFDSPLLFLDCLVVNESLSKQSYKSACYYFSVFMILNINFYSSLSSHCMLV